MSKNLQDALRSFLRVWIVGTLTLFLPGLFGWINEVTKWAKHEGSTPFPDAHGLVFLFVAAITSAFVAAGAAILRLVENYTGKALLPRPAGPETPPRRGEFNAAGEQGATSTRTIALTALVIAVVVLLYLLL